MYKLVISDDEGKTTTVPLVRDEITIGRKEGNTIRLTDRNVSRRHAKLQKQNGGYVLQDLGSYNGTVINGTRLSDQRALKMGDQIVIGDYKLNIVEESAAQVAPAATPAPSAAASVVETYEAPAPSGGHHPQATMPAIPTALGVPPPVTTPVPDHLKRLQLVFLAPAGTPSPYTITKLPVLLGRSEIADVSLPFSSISREHAKITLENDQLMIEDLGSSNGVVVNGERVKKHAIKAGDAITMGVVECKLGRVGEAVAATQLAPMASAAISSEPEVAAPAKKSSVGTLVGVGVLVAILGGGGAVVAMRGNNTSTAATGQNSTVVTGSEPANTTANSGSATQAAQPTQPAANTQQAAQAPQNNGQPEQNGNAAPQNTAPETNPPTNTNSNTNNQAVAQNDPQNDPPQNGQTDPAPTTQRGSEPRVRVRSTSTTGSSESGSSGTSAATQSTTTTTARTTTSSTGNSSATQSAGSSTASSGGTQNVAQCMLANDFQCVVGALRNRAATEVEFNQLVTAYKGLHNQAAAEQTMRRYLSRFPDGRYAERYRDTLGQ